VNTPDDLTHYMQATSELRAEVERLQEERDRLAEKLEAIGKFASSHAKGDSPDTLLYALYLIGRESEQALVSLPDRERPRTLGEDATQPITCRRHGKRDCPYCLTVPWPDRGGGGTPQ
jgi:hypothetical protein